MNIQQLVERRGHALDSNRASKARMTRSTRILRNEWRAVWPDLTTTESEPSVENVYLEAAEDKAATAASVLPVFDVPPRRGTRSDRGERAAQQARRVFLTLAQNSRLDAHHVGFYMDWFVFGLPSGLVWKDWRDPQGFPFIIRIPPAHLYPLSWNTRGELTEGLIIKRRRYIELLRDYGPGHAALAKVAGTSPATMYEEIVWADGRDWGIAIAREDGVTDGDFSYRRPSDVGYGRVAAEWLINPHPHKLEGNPIVAARASSADGEIRGKLDAMLPPLKTAHALQLEVLLNVRRSLHAPPLIQNVENEENWGPDAIMRGTKGPDEARVEYPRPPAAFEAFTHVKDQLDAARGAGSFPQQRSGSPGASIASGEAVQRLQGSYNAQQSWAQTDIARFYSDLFVRLANFDEQWCGGEKQIDGFDAGEAFTDKYDPATFWKGDYRARVTFRALGVDAHTHLLNLGAAHRLGWLSSRSAMEQSGLVQNPLAEERDIVLDDARRLFFEMLAQQVAQGDDSAFTEYVNLVDAEGETVRSAMLKVLSQRQQQTAAQPAAQPPPAVSPELLSLVGAA